MPGGRPTKLSPEITAELIKLLKAGNYIETAAAAVGINKDTLHTWLKEGARAKSGPLREFSDSIKAAMGWAEVSLLGVIARAATGTNGKAGQWQAAAWMLERMHPDRFAQQTRSKTEGSLEVSGPQKRPLSVLSDEQLDRVMEMVRPNDADEGGP